MPRTKAKTRPGTSWNYLKVTHSHIVSDVSRLASWPTPGFLFLSTWKCRQRVHKPEKQGTTCRIDYFQANYSSITGYPVLKGRKVIKDNVLWKILVAYKKNKCMLNFLNICSHVHMPTLRVGIWSSSKHPKLNKTTWRKATHFRFATVSFYFEKLDGNHSVM